MRADVDRHTRCLDGSPRPWQGASFERVVDYVVAWGVDLHFVPAVAIQALFDLSWTCFERGPIEGGIFIEEGKRRIVWPEALPTNAVHKDKHAASLLHELSHCLAKDPPGVVDEVESEMLAFEWYSQRYLRLGREWQAFMASYDIGQGMMWSEAPAKYKSAVVGPSRKFACEAGLIDDKGKPTFKTPEWCKVGIWK